MLYLGQNITAPSDALQPIEENDLYSLITNPKSETLSLLQRLQAVRSVDAKSYASLKRRLPYFVCGNFNPPIRCSENFANIDCFVLDIDHISAQGISPEELRLRIQLDPRVRLSFLSPSGDGLKLLFHLKERCCDKGLFSVFYHTFAQQFAAQYHIEQVIDTRTCDVTRACFLSHDPNAYYCPFAEEIDLNAYIDTTNPTELFDQKKEQEKQQQLQSAPKSTDHEPTDDAIVKIKKTLELYKAKPTAVPVYVPEQLNMIISDLQAFLAGVDMIVTEIVDIQYGKKIKAKLGIKQAECNLFFGRRGFSVVISPRSGTDAELNDMLQQLIQAFLSQL